MKNKKFLTLGFLSIGLTFSLLFSNELFAKTEEKSSAKTEASRLESLAKFSKVISIVEQYSVDDITIEELKIGRAHV